MTRDTGLLNYVEWANIVLNAYIYFLVVREGLTRRGFRPDIVVRWMLATLCLACLVAIAQARDFGGVRAHIDAFYHQAEIEGHMEGPSMPWQARAPATHANSLAIMLVCGFPLLLAISDLKRFRWFDWLVGTLMIVTIFMSFSRIGIISLAAVGLGIVIVLTIRKDYLKAATATISLAALVLLFVSIVYAFDINRFKVLMENTGSVSNVRSDQTIGWKLREESLNRSIALAERYPVLGLNAASGALNQQDMIVKNAYTYQGLLLNVYAYSFVSYGLLGVAFMLALFLLILSQVRKVRQNQVFAATAFVLGIGLLVAGIAENVLFFDGAMITVNIVMAFCVMRVSRTASNSETALEPASSLAA